MKLKEVVEVVLEDLDLIRKTVCLHNAHVVHHFISIF